MFCWTAHCCGVIVFSDMVSLGNIRLVLAILVMTAIIGIVTAITLRGSKQALPKPVLQQLPQNIDVAMHKARFTEMRDGTAVWELVAERAEYDKSGDVAYLSGIRMDFAKSRSAGAITITAARGEYSSRNRNVTLRGGVRVTSESGMRFDTESIEYLASRSLLRTAKPVTFSHQRLALAAQGMDLDVRDQKARFHKSVDATVAGL